MDVHSGMWIEMRHKFYTYQTNMVMDGD